MSQQEKIVRNRRTFPLSVYIPLLLVCAVIFPLMITVISSEILSRPALITQASTVLETDAQTRMQLINAYFVERLKDMQTVSQFTPVKRLLAGDQNSQNGVLDELVIAQHRDAANYTSWSLFDPQGRLLLAYPTSPQRHGRYYILPDEFKQMQHSSKVLISDIFYDATGNQASVDMYARVITNSFHVLGFVRATLGLHHIWDIVDSETRANGTGSYAFILDQNGVRIAYTNPDSSGLTHSALLFKSVAPLSQTFMQRIGSENLYGNNKTPVSAVVDQTLADMQNVAHPPASFQITPAGQGQDFQAARYTSLVVPWTYIILKPLKQVTSIADRQLQSTLLVGAIVLILALVAGLTTAQYITRPVLRSVAFLRRCSQSLKTFSNQEALVVKEQSWMVEASRVGLKSVQYYTNANSVAADKLQDICIDLVQSSQHLDPLQVRQALKEILETSTYIKQATKYQDSTNEKLAAAVRVTTQVTDQLSMGARSAEDAAIQLEDVVNQLRSLVGHDGTPVNAYSAFGSV